MIRERVMVGLSRAKDADKVAAIVAARAKGTGIRRIARDLGVGWERAAGEVTGRACLAARLVAAIYARPIDQVQRLINFR
jgi:hypothetical protein